MNELKKTENLILLLLWILSASTFTTALLNNYNLFISDYIGIAGLLVVTTIFIFKPEKKIEALLFLLIIGTFNVASFVYFFNVVFTFGFGTLVSPGIQIVSLIFFTVLFLKRKNKMTKIVRYFLGTTEEDKLQAFEQRKNNFKERFKDLSEQEINTRLANDLQPEAKQALIELKKEKNALQHSS
ncbi:MAG: hypothetical protein MK078_18265 [Crocinitomicaceae bacterium]|nr:hypothetical protein [Crocinitomicaceae bacterium]